MKVGISKWIGILCLAAAPAAMAQGCPDKNVNYWQAFPPGGESDLSARHQQVVLKKKCPAIDTIIQYKAGAGGGADVVADEPAAGRRPEHRRRQPAAHRVPADRGQVQYKTADVTPVFWFHFTPDALVVPEASPLQDLRRLHRGREEGAGQDEPGRLGPQLGQPCVA